MTLALIINNIIINCVDADREDLIQDPMLTNQCDLVIRIDELDPEPGIGWSYDGEVFSPSGE